MKIVSNKKLIEKNKKIGQYLMWGSLGIVVVAMYLLWTKPEQMNYLFPIVIVGFFAMQFASYYSSKFGLSPRPDEILSQSLKGLDNKFTLYHYVTPSSHLLVGPAGLWILLPFHQGGTITFDQKTGRWKQKGGNLYLKIFGQESLGRPDQQIKASEKDLQKFLDKNFSNIELPETKTLLVFTSDKAVLDIEDAAAPTLPAKKIKDFFRKMSKSENVSPEIITMIQKSLPQEDILPKQKKK